MPPQKIKVTCKPANARDESDGAIVSGAPSTTGANVRVYALKGNGSAALKSISVTSHPASSSATVTAMSSTITATPSGKCLTNNIVQLSLTVADIRILEGLISASDTRPDNADKLGVPVPWNNGASAGEVEDRSSLSPTKVADPAQRAQGAREKIFETLVNKRPAIVIKDPKTATTSASTSMASSVPITTVNQPIKQVVEADDSISRKDLIINSGVKRQSKQLLSVFAKDWPTYSPYACWNDCHTFETTPVGIPHRYVDGCFHCYGNFCSYNCAKRYLLPKDEADDLATLSTSHDTYVSDSISEQLQLLELLCHLETGAPLEESIVRAPNRLVTKLFGGDKSIEEYRGSFRKNTKYHVFRSPLVPISYQVEECTGAKADTKRKARGTSLDMMKIERAYDSLTKGKDGTQTVLQKMFKKKTT